MKKNELIGIILSISLVGGIFSYILYYSKDTHRHNCKDSFNGIVLSQEYNIQRVMAVEINDLFYSLGGYNIREGDDVLRGDSLYKEKCSNRMVVYRKDTLSNEYKLVEYYYLAGECKDCE